MTKIVSSYVGTILAVACLATVADSLRAQQPNELNRLYAQGVNAYFAGRSSEAEMYLSQAMALESEDPRLYYFRALSLLRLDRVDEARGDMMVGAAIEAKRPRRYAVGRALERVQGGHRLTLERYRRQARSEAASIPSQPAPPQPTYSRPQQTSFNDDGALRRRIVIPLDRLLGPGSPQPLTAEELSRRAQARASQTAPSGPTRVTSPAASNGVDPFQDDPTSAATQGATAAPPEQPPEDIAPPEVEATEAAEMPEADETPEAEATPEGDEDPFGDFE